MLLPSRQITFFHRLGQEAKDTYDNLKAALKTSAETSPDQLHTCFYSCVPNPRDTAVPFVIHSQCLLAEWIQLAGICEEEFCNYLVWDPLSHDMPPQAVAYIQTTECAEENFDLLWKAR